MTKTSTSRGWAAETNDPTYDLVAALHSRRTRWLEHILRVYVSPNRDYYEEVPTVLT